MHNMNNFHILLRTSTTAIKTKSHYKSVDSNGYVYYNLKVIQQEPTLQIPVTH